MNCNVVRDLIPLYVDELCSEDTKKIVFKHIRHCKDCKSIYESMLTHADSVKSEKDAQLKSNNDILAHKKKNKSKILIAIVITFTIIVGTTYLLLQHVGSIHNFFFPEQRIIVNKENNDWEDIGTDILFNSIFYKKTIINDANSGGPMEVVVVDENEDMIVGPFSVSPGESYSLKELNSDQTYRLQILAAQGKYFININ